MLREIERYNNFRLIACLISPFAIIALFILTDYVIAQTPPDCDRDGLPVRVEQCYKTFRDRDFEKFIDFVMPGSTKMSKFEGADLLKKLYRFQVVSYEVKFVKFEALRATIKMHMTFIFPGSEEEAQGIHYDSWSCSGGTWYLCDFGRTDEAVLEDCQDREK